MGNTHATKQEPAHKQHRELFLQYGKKIHFSSKPLQGKIGIWTTNANVGKNLKTIIGEAGSWKIDVHPIGIMHYDFVENLKIETMQQYDVIVVDTCLGVLRNAQLVENILAEYVELGNKNVVIGMFTNCSNHKEQAIRGQFEQYHPLEYTQQVTSSSFAKMGTLCVAQHPILHHITKFNGGERSVRAIAKASAEHAYVIAEWQDSLPLLVEKYVPFYNSRIIGLNYTTGSNKCIDYSWDEKETCGKLILQNCIHYLLADAMVLFSHAPATNHYQDVAFCW